MTSRARTGYHTDDLSTLKASLEQLSEGGLAAVQPCAYLQPARPKSRAAEEPPLGQVGIEHA